MTSQAEADLYSESLPRPGIILCNTKMTLKQIRTLYGTLWKPGQASVTWFV